MAFVIEIDSNTGKITRDMSTLKADLAAFKGQLEKSTDTQTITKLNKAIKDTELALKGVKQIGFDSAEIRSGANQATNAMINFSRVIQDAPFGIIGVANNIDPLITSFITLKKETGSAGAAFKALGASLMGAGGLGLAISIVTSALTVFSLMSRGAKQDVEDMDKSFKEFMKTVKDVDAIQIQAIGSNTGNIAVVKELARVVMDSNSSYGEQKRALEELQTINKSYFGDIKLGADNFKLLTDRVNDYANALIATAKVKGLTDEISRLNTQLLNEDRTLKNLKTVWDQTKTAIANYKEESIVVDGEVVKSSAGLDFLRKTAKGAEEAFVNQRNKVEQLGVSMALLNGDIESAVGQQLKFSSTTAQAAKSVDLLKQRIDALKELQGFTGLDLDQRLELSRLEVQLINRDAIRLGFTPQEIKEKVQATIDSIFPKEFTNFFVRSTFFVEPQFSVVKNAKPLTENEIIDIAKAIGLPDTITPPAMTINPPKNITIDPFANAIGDAFANSLSLIGEKIGEAFATGDFVSSMQAAAQGILSILGDVLIGIGKQLIATSALVKALKAALKGIFGPGGDAAALAVGIGLVAFGGLLKNIQFEGPKLADGGVVTGSTIANVGEAGDEVVAPLTKLPYLMNQANGGSSGAVSVGLRIKGRELLAFIERERSLAKRLG